MLRIKRGKGIKGDVDAGQPRFLHTPDGIAIEGLSGNLQRLISNLPLSQKRHILVHHRKQFFQCGNVDQRPFFFGQIEVFIGNPRRFLIDCVLFIGCHGAICFPGGQCVNPCPQSGHCLRFIRAFLDGGLFLLLGFLLSRRIFLRRQSAAVLVMDMIAGLSLHSGSIGAVLRMVDHAVAVRIGAALITRHLRHSLHIAAALVMPVCAACRRCIFRRARRQGHPGQQPEHHAQRQQQTQRLTCSFSFHISFLLILFVVKVCRLLLFKKTSFQNELSHCSASSIVFFSASAVTGVMR